MRSGVVRRLPGLALAGLLLALCLAPAAVRPALALTVGYFIEEPHAMVVAGRPGGAAVEYLRDHIGPAMGETIEFVGPLPFRRLLDEFAQGEFDALLFLARTPGRERRFVYPVAPFALVKSGLLAAKGRLPDPITAASQLRGLRIGFSHAWRPPILHDPSLTFDLVTALDATVLNLRKYREGRIDVVFNPDWQTLVYQLRHVDDLPPSSVVTIAGTVEGLYTVFHPHVPRSIVRNYEQALKKVRSELTYPQLLDRYMAQ